MSTSLPALCIKYGIWRKYDLGQLIQCYLRSPTDRNTALYIIGVKLMCILITNYDTGYFYELLKQVKLSHNAGMTLGGFLT